MLIASSSGGGVACSPSNPGSRTTAVPPLYHWLAASCCPACGPKGSGAGWPHDAVSTSLPRLRHLAGPWPMPSAAVGLDPWAGLHAGGWQWGRESDGPSAGVVARPSILSSWRSPSCNRGPAWPGDFASRLGTVERPVLLVGDQPPPTLTLNPARLMPCQ